MTKMCQEIQPGLCPINPTTGLPECPPPDRIECIVVDKVYDSCFQVDNRSRTITSTVLLAGLAVGDVVNCALTPGESISCEEVSRVPVGDGLFKVTLVVTVPVTITNPNNIAQIDVADFVFTKTVILCAPEPVQVTCSESAVIGCGCVVTATVGTPVTAVTITCDIQICVVIKSILRVQLLVPSYGFCIPTPCEPIGVCPTLPPAQCLQTHTKPTTCGCKPTI